MSWRPLAFLALACVATAGACRTSDNAEVPSAGDPSGRTVFTPATDNASLKEYFRELRRIGDRFRERSAGIDQQFELTATDPDEYSPERAARLLADYYTALIPVVRQSLDEMKAISPPSEVELIHQRLVAAVEERLQELESLAVDLVSVRSTEDIRELLGSSEKRFAEAITGLEPCFELQEIALDEGIDVNLACGHPEDWDNPLIASRRPEFLTPVAQARRVGIAPYWLGEQFQIDDVTVHLTRDIEFLDSPDGDPGFSAQYSDLDNQSDISISLDVQTYAESGNGAERLRQDVVALAGRTAPIEVGQWPGELISVPAGARPVNAQVMFLDVGDMTVVVSASSGSTGVPGTDSNPLLDSNLLVETITKYLQPYTQ